MRINEVISIDPVMSTFERLMQPEFVHRVQELHSRLAKATDNFTLQHWASTQKKMQLLSKLGADYDYAAKTLGRQSQSYALIQEIISYLSK